MANLHPLNRVQIDSALGEVTLENASEKKIIYLTMETNEDAPLDTLVF